MKISIQVKNSLKSVGDVQITKNVITGRNNLVNVGNQLQFKSLGRKRDSDETSADSQNSAKSLST